MDPMDKVRRALHRGINYREANYQCVEDYIKDLEKYCLKLEVRYDELCEGYEELVCNWVRLKKENRELNKKYNELLEDFNRINSEPLLRKMTIAEVKERGFLRNESK